MYIGKLILCISYPRCHSNQKKRREHRSKQLDLLDLPCVCCCSAPPQRSEKSGAQGALSLREEIFKHPRTMGYIDLLLLLLFIYIYMLDIIIVFICFINQQTSRDWETHLAPVESVAPGSSVDHRRRFLASSCPFSWHVQKGSRPGAITKAAVENHHSHRFDFRKVSKTGSPL